MVNRGEIFFTDPVLSTELADLLGVAASFTTEAVFAAESKVFARNFFPGFDRAGVFNELSVEAFVADFGDETEIRAAGVLVFVAMIDLTAFLAMLAIAPVIDGVVAKTVFGGIVGLCLRGTAIEEGVAFFLSWFTVLDSDI